MPPTDCALPDLADPAVPHQHGLGTHHLAGPLSAHLEDPVGEEPAGPGPEPDALLLQWQSHRAEGLPAQRHPHLPGGGVTVRSPHPHRTRCAEGGSAAVGVGVAFGGSSVMDVGVAFGGSSMMDVDIV